ncbi:MAG: PKD domain-containing protein [Chitinophagales bacterium]|nr:PKD domain-containing protein [Chitinophagales bacterium]
MIVVRTLHQTVFTFLLLLFCAGTASAYSRLEHEMPDGIRFTENKGQWDAFIKYRSDLAAGNIYFEAGALTFNMWDADALHEARHGHPVKNISTHAHKLSFVGASATPGIKPSFKEPEYRNYFLGNDQSKWKGNVGIYRKLLYENVWNNINLHWYGSGDALKYDVHILPGGNAADVQLKYDGVDNIRIQNGELCYETSLGKFTERKPYAYQVIGGTKKEVECRYAFNHATSVLSFEFPKGYNTNYELVIDPTLVFSSYTGSTADNFGFTATYDSLGNLYAGGIVFGFGYPFTTGAYQTAFGGGIIDMSITKFNSTGTNIIYSTYIGGNDNDQPSSLVVNHLNELVILGTTSSLNYPTTTGAYDATFNGGNYVNYPSNGVEYVNGSDIVVTVLNSTGTGLIGSTLLGGSDNDGLNDAPNLHYNYGDQFRGEVVINPQNEIYVASSTRSPNFPTAGSPFQNTLNGTHDACVFKLNRTCTQLLFSTFLGGSNADAAFGIKLDSLGLVYVTGGTSSTDFPTTAGVIHPTYRGGVTDGYVAKFSANGSQLLSATYLGTTSYDQSFFVEIDGDGDVYVTGQSLGSYQVTSGVYNNPGGKQFIHKLNNTFTSTLYSTVFGSGSATTNISPTAFLVDICENVYVSGWGGQVNQFAPNPSTLGNTVGMAVTPDAYKATTDGSDFYYIVLNKNAGSLLYATFFGGNQVSEHVDGGTSRFDRNGIIYQAMCAGCGGNSFTPTTPGVWSNVNSSFNCNVLGLKMEFNLAGTNVQINAFPRATGCVPLDVQFSSVINNAQSFVWHLGDGTTSTIPNPFHTYTDTGVYIVMLIGVDSSSCNIVDTAFLDVVVRDDSIVADFTPNLLINCDSNKVTLSAVNYGSTQYHWNMGDGTVYTSNPVTHYYQSTGSKTITLIVSDTSKCNLADTFSAPVFIPHKVSASFSPNNSSGCIPLTINFSTTQVATASYNWSFGDGNVASQNPVSHTYTTAGVYTVRLIVTDTSSCNKIDTAFTTITVIDSSADADFQFIRTFFGCDSVLVTVWSTYQGEDSQLWDFGDGTQATTDTASHMYNVAGTYTITHYIADADMICKPLDTAQIVISLEPLHISIAIPDTGGCLPFTANFTGNSALLSTDYTWIFGDGNSATGKNVSHTYQSTGTFDVMLIASDTNACVGADTTFAQITVINDSVTAAFQLNLLNACDSNLVIDLVNQSVNALTYLWDFGDGTTSTQFNESHTYTIPGSYTVTLIVTDTNRCHPVDTFSRVVSLLPNALAAFTANNVCKGTAVQFTNLGNPNAQYLWSFGNGTFSNMYSPSHLYLQPGVYNVRLVIIDTASCDLTDTAYASIEIFEQPIAGFNVMKDTFRFGTPVTFYNNSIYYSELFWDFGDGNTAYNELTPVHTYDKNIEWIEICITAWNEQCADTYCRSIFIDYSALIGVPNAFSPNGDGINDVVKVEGKGIVELTFRIFNRWGEKVFETSDKNQGWDGYYKGMLQEMDVYTYAVVAKLINGKEVPLKGNITLLR